MKQEIEKIENLYRKRISLFRDLLNCIARERDNLINQDTKGIWSTMEEKHKILESIDETREHIEEIKGRVSTYQDIPRGDRQSIIELSRTLASLKVEIKTRVAENISFVKETIHFFHEIISVLTASGRKEVSYGPVKNSRHESTSLIYHSEV